MALIEKLDYESVIVERMRKTLRIGSLRDYLIKIYSKYEKLYGRNYIDEAFGWFGKQEDPKYSRLQMRKENASLRMVSTSI